MKESYNAWLLFQNNDNKEKASKLLKFTETKELGKFIILVIIRLYIHVIFLFILRTRRVD